MGTPHWLSSEMDKLKLASSSFTERLKTGGSQMTRIVSSKMKEVTEMLQPPTPESKIVDEATVETMEEPNWGLNLRICAMINGEELNGTEIVKAIKKKVLSKSAVSQRLSLDLLETCSSNCEKVFSEVASVKVPEDMVRMIQDLRFEQGNRQKAFQLIRAWGESEDLVYLPVFRQTYMSLKTTGIPVGSQDGNPSSVTLESYIDPQPMPPPERYPMPAVGLEGAENATFAYSYGGQSVEEKKEILLVTRNSLDLLSSILNSGMEPIPIKDELTVTMLENCKQSLPLVQRIAETTTDDDVMLFEALNLHDELQQVISRCDEIGSALVSEAGTTQSSDAMKVDTENHPETKSATFLSSEVRGAVLLEEERTESSGFSNGVKEAESSESSKEVKQAVPVVEECAVETRIEKGQHV